MLLQILGMITIVLYVGFNLVTAKTHSAKEMRDEFVSGQCVVGVVLANLFYAPAWALKLVRGIIVAAVK